MDDGDGCTKMHMDWMAQKFTLKNNFSVYILPSIFFKNSFLKKWIIDACYNMDELRKHYAKWKKPDIKSSILYDVTYMKHQG
jgi:hypothetical protein